MKLRVSPALVPAYNVHLCLLKEMEENSFVNYTKFRTPVFVWREVPGSCLCFLCCITKT